MKPPSSIIGTGGEIVRPRFPERVDFEGELGVVIKEPCRNVGENETSALHSWLHLRQRCDGARSAKERRSMDTGEGFDTFCPVGPLVTDAVDPWKGVQVERASNGTSGIRQHHGILFSFRCDHPLHLPCNDSSSGRPDLHRHSRRR